MKKIYPDVLWPFTILLALFIAAIAFRPLLPIDETRYMSVAWEMHLHNGWFSPLTMNFEPYSHKPPFLFWLINLSWAVFGVTRWAALIPPVLSSLAVILLTVGMGRKLLSADQFDPLKITLLFLGSLPFLIYSTLMMFDLTLTVFVLAALLCLLNYTDKNKFISMMGMGLLTGLAVLTKGPVAYLYILPPALFAPLWHPNFNHSLRWYGHIFCAVIISIVPVTVWLVPVLQQSDHHFAFWLLWEQTAGRVTGNFNEAHVRPFYFYLPFVPLLISPWIFFPQFWKGVRTINTQSVAFQFLLCWVVPVFIIFSIVSGKQPHYLLPLLPGFILILSIVLKDCSILTLQKIVCGLVVLVFIGQAISSHTIFRNHDLAPPAAYIQKHSQQDWAFVRNYQGEFGFLSKLEKPMANLELNELPEWFRAHPDGLAVIRYANDEEISEFEKISFSPYRGKFMGIFKRKS